VSHQERYRELIRQPQWPVFGLHTASDAPTETSLDRMIASAARRFRVDRALVKAVVASESNFEIRAVSRVGALGLMQLMPQTAREMNVTAPFDPRENLKGGVRYLREMLDRYGDLTLALAAYNAGPSAVDRHGGIPPYRETEEYVTRVLGHFRRYRGELPN
jgi:soluble lytic murein transglycosylase